MGKVSTGVVVSVLVLLGTDLGAQPMLRSGARELSVHVSPDFEGAVGDMLSARAGFGLFVRDGVSLRATVDYALLEDVAGEDSDYRMSRFGIAGEYHLRRGARLVPYVGLGVGWQSSHFGEVEESALIYGPRGGLKYFLADNVALDFEVTYHWAGADVFINEEVPHVPGGEGEESAGNGSQKRTGLPDRRVRVPVRLRGLLVLREIRLERLLGQARGPTTHRIRNVLEPPIDREPRSPCRPRSPRRPSPEPPRRPSPPSSCCRGETRRPH